MPSRATLSAPMVALVRAPEEGWRSSGWASVIVERRVTRMSRDRHPSDGGKLARPQALIAPVVDFCSVARQPERAQNSLSSNSASGPIVPIFDGYTTVVTRQIEGIAVPDSFAAARFNEDDDVIEEWVYWPPLPRAAIDDAKTLAALQVEPSSRSTFRDKLPPFARSGNAGEPTIRHSDFADECSFVAFGSYDVQVSRSQNGGFRGGTHNFDVNGREVLHPNRRPNLRHADSLKISVANP